MTEETEKLTLRHFDGSASADDLSSLDRAIQSDPATAQAVIASAALDLRLYDGMASAGRGRTVSLPQRQEVSPQVERRSYRLAPRWWITGIAAAVLVAAGVWVWYPTTPASSQPQARGPAQPLPAYTLTHSPAGLHVERSGVDPRTDVAATLKPGDLLRTDQEPAMLAITGEATTIQLAPGSSIRLEPSDHGPRIRVERGTVDCQVAPQKPGRSFVVVTNDAEARVIGTVLRVTSDASHSAVQVTHGTVRVTRLKDKATVDVSGGEYVAVGKVVQRPVGRDMGEYWSTKVRPAGIDQ
jgi:ferric-dicitrate binding protein FerR (iron transport regulator)